MSQLTRFAAALVALFALSVGNRAANVQKDVRIEASDLTAGASYVVGGNPRKNWDVTFTSQTYFGTTFTVNANLGIGTLNDLNATQGLVVTNNGSAGRTLTLNGGGNTVAGSAATDLIYIAAAGSLSIQDGSRTLELALSSDGDFHTGAGGLLSITSIISGRFDLEKTGAGTLTLSGANTFGGNGRTFTLTGGILNINAAGALGNASNTFIINGGTTIDNSSGVAITTRNYGVVINGGFTFAGGGTGTAHDLNLGTGNITLGTAAGSSRTITTTASNSTLTLGGRISNGTTANSLIKAGAGTLVLGGANTYTGGTVVNAGTLVAGNNLAFGAAARTVTLNGGGLASNNDTRALANPIIVTAAGGQITGSNSMTLTGAVTNGGAGSKLKVNLADGSKTVTINPVTAGSFAPGELEISIGTLLLGGANKIADTTKLTMSGGTLKTGGFSDTLGALTLSADSNLDFGTSENVRLQFASASWTGGTLSIANWTGAAGLGNNPDQLLVTGPVSQDFLNQISFQGFGPGAIAFDRGGGLYEVVPVPEPATILGALSLFGVVGFRERRRLVRILHPFFNGKQ